MVCDVLACLGKGHSTCLQHTSRLKARWFTASVLAAFSPAIFDASMGRGDKKKESSRGKQVRKDGKGKTKGEGPKFVPKFEYFAKSKLAAYPSEEGKCVYTEKNHDEKDFFKLKNILKTRNSGNEELCHRIGMGLALDAASAHHGVEVLHKHFGEAIPAVPEEHAAQLGKTGLPKLLEALRSESGKKFVGCLTVLNVGKSGQPAESDVKDAVKTFVAYLQDPKGTLHRNLTRLATDAAALYLFAMTLLKDMALVQSPEGWAEKVEGKQSDAVKAWKRKPADEKKLRQALVTELMAKVENNEPAPGKKRRVSDSSSAASTASGGTGSSKGGSSSEEASGENSDGSAGSGRSTSSGKASSSSSAPKKDNNKKKDKKKDRKKDAKEKKPKERKDTKDKKEEKDKKNNKEDKKIEAKEKKNPKEKEADAKEKKSKKPGKSGKEKKTKGDAVSLDSEADVIESSSQNEERHDKDKKSKKAEQKQKEKELQAEKRRERKEAAEAAEEARTAAFTTWPSAAVQEAAEQLEDAKASIGLLTGRFKKEGLVNLTRLIPAQVLAQFPEVCVATADLAHVEGEWVSNKEAKPALVMLLDVASAVAAFWAEHAEAASSSGEAAAEAKVNEAEEHKKEG